MKKNLKESTNELEKTLIRATSISLDDSDIIIVQIQIPSNIETNVSNRISKNISNFIESNNIKNKFLIVSDNINIKTMNFDCLLNIRDKINKVLEERG